MTAQQHRHGSRTQQQVSSTASPRGGMLPGSNCLCQTGWLTKLPDTAHPSLSPAISWEQSLNQHKALLPPSVWLCSRLHLASIIQRRLTEALRRHEGVDELSMSREVGSDGEEPLCHGLAESSQDRHHLLPVLAPATASLALPEPGRTGATGGCQGTRAEHGLGSLQFCLGDQPWELESCYDDSRAPPGKGG